METNQLNVEEELGPRLKDGVKKNEPMSRHTSLKVGGEAEYFLVPEDSLELAEIIRYSQSKGLPLFVFGSGSNLLVREGGIKGLTVHIGPAFQYMHREE